MGSEMCIRDSALKKPPSFAEGVVSCLAYLKSLVRVLKKEKGSLMNLEGKVSLVSACGRGIGREIALTLAREGSNLIINSFSEENTRALKKELEVLGTRVVAISGDITQSKVILETVDAGIQAFGNIDILVNNVGGGSVREVVDKENPLAEVEAVWDGTYAMSLKAPVLMCEDVLPHFIEMQ